MILCVLLFRCVCLSLVRSVVMFLYVLVGLWLFNDLVSWCVVLVVDVNVLCMVMLILCGVLWVLFVVIVWMELNWCWSLVSSLLFCGCECMSFIGILGSVFLSVSVIWCNCGLFSVLVLGLNMGVFGGVWWLCLCLLDKGFNGGCVGCWGGYCSLLLWICFWVFWCVVCVLCLFNVVFDSVILSCLFVSDVVFFFWWFVVIMLVRLCRLLGNCEVLCMFGSEDCDVDVLDDVCVGGVVLEWWENIFMMGEGFEGWYVGVMWFCLSIIEFCKCS